ncbi:MAG: sigma-70 family RNA polymerase sigma factor [Pirellulaceae bacterium]|nr:sigma-70 family RNA polymerase sigma factor [Pirellulaceae bacterium]
MPDTRISLILRLPRTADAAAWREFVELYEPLVLRFARRRGLQEADAMDLVQRVFASVAGAVDRWQPDAKRGKFRAWLFRIARNHLINQAALRRRERPVGGSTQVRRLHSEIDERVLEASDVELEYRRAVFESAAARVKRLVQPATWTAFWETMVVGRSCESVAEELSMSVGAIYVARSRVVARLRAVAEELEANDA